MRLRRVGQLVVLAVVGVLMLAVAPAGAAVQAERPGFQLPLPCGTRWTTASHDGHASQWMIDMVAPNGNSSGMPVLAAAGGTVSASLFSSTGGNMVVIDHGDGWQTRYLHLNTRSVALNDTVAQGQQLGTVGTTGDSTGPHLHFEQKLNGVVQQSWFDGHAVPLTWSYNEHFETSANCGGGPGDTRFWVDTFANAPGYDTPGGTKTGTLNKGTNYVYCKVPGPEVRVGSSFNHWWLRTDLDVGPKGQYVSAYYLSRWGNDEAKDNNGVVIADC
jgi:hypothetical protein